MQREGLGACDGSELYFETKHKCTEKCTTGSIARAGSEARPGSERRRPATGQNTERIRSSVVNGGRRPE